jgi:DNA polymerase-1
MRLKKLFEISLGELGFESLFRDVEMPLCLVLKRMEQEGVAIDAAKLVALSGTVMKDLDRLTTEIHRLAGEEFNINSAKQLQRILFEKLGLAKARKTKTGFSTDEEVLSELVPSHPIAASVLEYRQLSKMKNTYIDALPRLVNPRTGRIHTSFNQTVTATGRLSSSEPNLQNIPVRTELGRAIRSAFIPRRGNILMDADYSQIELRIMAHLSKDAGFVETFRDGGDIHARTAARINGVDESEVTAGMRARAKTINFGVIYGMGPRGLSNQLGIGIDEAKRFIDEYFEKYPGVKGYIDSAIARARREGCAETLLGRKRLLGEIDSENNRTRSFSERIAVNMPIQGTAADMIKLAMIRIDRDIMEEGLGSRMILQVHDELVFEVVPGERDRLGALVKEAMESALALDVPVRVDIGFGENWLEAHR